MGTTGKISVIPKDFNSAFPTMEKSLRDNGFSMVPGCKKLFMPYKEPDGKYLTGLDENASYIKRLAKINPEAAEIERKKIRERLEKLKDALGNIDLSPRSSFWSPVHNPNIVHGLKDGDNFFALDNANEAVKFYFLSVHPKIAPSLEAYNRGDCHADTHWYIADDEKESEIIYRKNKRVTDALNKFESFSLEKQRKIVMLLGEPITETAKETTVFNTFHAYINASEILRGPFKGQDPVRVFETFATSQDEILDVKYLMKQAFDNQILRMKAGRVWEGEVQVYNSEDELFETLLDVKNQDIRFALEKKLKMVKLAEI